MRLYDTHCHLMVDPLSNVNEEVFQEAKEKEMLMNVVGFDLASSKKAIEYSLNYDFIKACVAIHPNDVQTHNYEEVEKTFRLWCHQYQNQIVAIGECGLDFHYTKKYVDLEYKFLLMQMQIALDFKLPLMLHIRDAHYEIIDFLKLHKPSVPIIFHCFSEGVEISNKILSELKELNFYFSIPGIVTFKNAVPFQEAVKILPLEKLMVETDSPWLTPAPFRGKTNKPSYVEYTIKQIGLLKNLNPEIVAETTFKNACKIFLKK
ncbi:TatD family hydrolase [[Mycoplasma] testudinis]|uniref:TatD family hydrolase n=1 Tax=[Mycoplasma] testudinis TaxID=33924 RepID=UPI000483B9AB|nr:TatD family hydrolase [[Mycoplasma] testudinis]